MASNFDVILEEIAALQAIMMDEVLVLYDEGSTGQPTGVEVIVKPATAQNIEEQHVRVTLIVNLPSGYPDESPSINLRNPRGIDDCILDLIQSETIEKCEEYLGLPVIYELIELVREKLTANNTPNCPCAICLFHFTDEDHFTKTPCFHYFHSHCLGRYILNCEESAAAEEKQDLQQPAWMTREKRQLTCPVCREAMDQEMNGRTLLAKRAPIAGEALGDFCSESPEILLLQEKMKALFLHQKSNGGIIDLEEEKNKFLISAASNQIYSLRENTAGSTEEAASVPDTNSSSNKQNKTKPESNPRTANGTGKKPETKDRGSNQGRRDYYEYKCNGYKGKNSKQGHKGPKTNNYDAPFRRKGPGAGYPPEKKPPFEQNGGYDRGGYPPRMNKKYDQPKVFHQNKYSQNSHYNNTKTNRTYNNPGPKQPPGSGGPKQGPPPPPRLAGLKQGPSPPPGFSGLDRNMEANGTS